jgi:hypothetical protein
VVVDGRGSEDQLSDAVVLAVPVDEALNSILQLRIGAKSYGFAEIINDAKSVAHNDRLHRQKILLCLFPERLFQALDEVHQFNRRIVANIENPIGR